MELIGDTAINRSDIMKPNYVILAQHIKSYRIKHNLSLRDFAVKAGVSHSYIDKIEKIGVGKQKEIEVTIDMLEKIAKASDITLASLLNLTGYISLDNIDLYKKIENLQSEIGTLKDNLKSEEKTKSEMSQKIKTLESKFNKIHDMSKI
jgi:Helix-turn-helix.